MTAENLSNLNSEKREEKLTNIGHVDAEKIIHT